MCGGCAPRACCRRPRLGATHSLACTCSLKPRSTSLHISSAIRCASSSSWRARCRRRTRCSVKLHKSDVPNYSRDFLARLQRFPGRAGSGAACQRARLHPRCRVGVCHTGHDRPGGEHCLASRSSCSVTRPSRCSRASRPFGRTIDLPQLVRARLAAPQPPRAAVVDAFAAYLAPFYPASHNDWALRRARRRWPDTCASSSCWWSAWRGARSTCAGDCACA